MTYSDEEFISAVDLDRNKDQAIGDILSEMVRRYTATWGARPEAGRQTHPPELLITFQEHIDPWGLTVRAETRKQ